ncbi:MAG: beta-Ala-His dipeptidase [Promethearchaeota archaeon]
MFNLKELGEPIEFWEYFEKISKIPRCSEHEEKIRSFIKKEADDLGYVTKVDKAGNLLIKIPVKSLPYLKGVLQCHMDMVCEKNEAVTHDFSKDPLKLMIKNLNGEKWLTADGTTLGADNGVGISYLLTLMKKIHKGEIDIDSLSLDLLFTVNEEQGLRGAFEIKEDFTGGDFLINIDAEEDNAVTIGCAGGIVTIYEVKIEKIKVEETYIPIKIFISGLLGGHSGVDINLGRGNALKIISQILWKLNKKFKIQFCSIDGGNKTNAIPREATSILYIEKDKFSEIKNFIETQSRNIKVIFEGIEPNLEISIKKLENYSNKKVFSNKFQDRILNIIYLIPFGPLSMHPQIKGLVFNSTNLGTIKTRDSDIEIKISQRSLSEYFKTVIWENVKALFDLSNLDFNFKIDSDYPGWTPNFESNILAKCDETYEDLFNEKIVVKAIHAGLECGILKKKFPQMDMIAIGPINEAAHSPDERLLIKSVEKVWKFIIALLKNLSCN